MEEYFNSKKHTLKLGDMPSQHRMLGSKSEPINQGQLLIQKDHRQKANAYQAGQKMRLGANYVS